MEKFVVESKELSKYVVLKKTSLNLPKGHWTYIAMIDRSKSKDHWWTINKSDSMVFTLKSAAERKAKSLKYGPCIAIDLKDFDKYVGLEFWKCKVQGDGLEKLLRDKESQWHDDDWCEADDGSGVVNN